MRAFGCPEPARVFGGLRKFSPARAAQAGRPA